MFSTKRSQSPSSLFSYCWYLEAVIHLSFWNLPSIGSSSALLKSWTWSLCVSIFVGYNGMPTELQSVCSTEARAGLTGYQFWPCRRLVLVIIIANFISSWSAEQGRTTRNIAHYKNFPNLTSFDHWYYKDKLNSGTTILPTIATSKWLWRLSWFCVTNLLFFFCL